ncbi:MAG: hypothetical protein UT39_C0004G0027 [Candidatus Woesebacteria bacterium GW2011_GWA1_39_21]|uniref:Uncharacterized protein n=1 Tax=Candidatus Woesebacteria bacterium GW2011_GWA1_39_21 TaxID=1618550 RepID=A0A0G0N8B1_9BACT|nr:MAG: hypothetical protein UT39_C0004G0027 [Candidatus Woesebacteria bacterium GW2011_GWA1_39_21]
MDNKKRLIQLIKIMKVPLSDKQALEFVEKSSDESVTKLVSVYEEIKKFEDNLEFVVKQTDPETYQKMKNEYYQKLLVLQEEFLKDAEEIQKSGDEQLDKEEVESGKKIEENYNSFVKSVNEVQAQHESLYQSLKQKLSTP